MGKEKDIKSVVRDVMNRILELKRINPEVLEEALLAINDKLDLGLSESDPWNQEDLYFILKIIATILKYKDKEEEGNNDEDETYYWYKLVPLERRQSDFYVPTYCRECGTEMAWYMNDDYKTEVMVCYHCGATYIRWGGPRVIRG